MTAEHKPRKMAEVLSGFGIAVEDIARQIGISPKTLRLHYADELALGHVKANAAIAQRLYNIAMGPGREAVTACIFWLKTRAGWSEYSPPPTPKPPGKKEMAEAEAVSAAADTGWDDLIRH